MTKKSKKVLVYVICGDGINCEQETAQSFIASGAQVQFIHLNELSFYKKSIKDAQIWALPGGFSFGDELGGGLIWALKMKKYLGDALDQFIAQDKAVLGICNGFQVLLKLKVFQKELPGNLNFSLGNNVQGYFIDSVVDIKSWANPSLWLKNLPTHFKLPIRHGEGRFLVEQENAETAFSILQENSSLALTYTQDINGSYGKVAAITNKRGNVLGMMPHPEAFYYKALVQENFSSDFGKKAVGATFFDNAVTYFA